MVEIFFSLSIFFIKGICLSNFRILCQSADWLSDPMQIFDKQHLL